MLPSKALSIVMAATILSAALKAEAAVPKGAVSLATGSTFIAQSGKQKFTCFRSSSNAVSAGKLAGSTHFVSFKVLAKNLKTSMKKLRGPKLAKAKKQLATYNKQNTDGTKVCKSAPPPTPIATNTPSQASYFDSDGNLTAAGKDLFEVPQSLSANVSRGRDVWNFTCQGCHSEAGRTNRTMVDLRSATTAAPMYFDESSLSNVTLADLTAYLGRFRRP